VIFCPSSIPPAPRSTLFPYTTLFRSGVLLYLQDQGGDENWQVYTVDVNSGAVKNVINNPKVAARIMESSDKHPDEILVGINDRRSEEHTSELQSQSNLVCRLLLEKKK